MSSNIGNINNLNGIRPQGPGTSLNNKVDDKGPSFKDALSANLAKGIKPTSGAEKALTLKFSNHAIERMRSRGLNYTPDQLNKIEDAVTMAKAKGAKETLVLTDNSALVVSVKNNTVVTVMDKNAMKENVFTKIDSTVVI